MSAASVNGGGLIIVRHILSDANEIPSNPFSNSIALQHRQYEACATVVPVATWLPPSYTVCIVQETAIPCYEPYPPSTCPAASPTPQPHLPKPNTDSSQSQSGSQSNTSSDASVNVSGGGNGGGSGSQTTAIIVGVTIGAVVLLVLIVVLAVQGAHRRHRRRPRSEGGNVLGPNYLTAGARSDIGVHQIHGHRDQRSTGAGGAGGNTGGEGGPGRIGMGDGRYIGANLPASVGRTASRHSENRTGQDISRGTPSSVSEPQPPAEVRQADVVQTEPPDQRPSRQPSIARSSRSRYRAEGHDEHPQNDFIYSPGPRAERIQRRRQRRGESGEDHISPLGGVEGEERTPNDVPLPSSPMRGVSSRRGATGELDRVNGDVQSPARGRLRRGRQHGPYDREAGEDDGFTA